MSKYETLVQAILRSTDNAEGAPRRFAMLDLRKGSHFQCVMELFGGEEYVRMELPGLYRRALNAKQGSVPADELEDGTVDHAVICDLTTTEDQSVYSFGLSSLKEVAQEIYSIMSIYSGDKRVGRNVSFEFNRHRAELDCLSAPVPGLHGGLRSVLHVTWTPQNSDVLRSMVLEAETLETVEDPVASAIFAHPSKTNYTALTPVPLNVPNPPTVVVRPGKKGPKLLPYVNVCYDRLPEDSESVNYAYGNTRIGQRQQRIFLDIRGLFTLKEKCKFHSLNSVAIGLELGSGGSAIYSSRIDEKANFEVAQDREVSFEFPTDWSVDIPSKKLAGREKSYVDVTIEFTYRDERSEDPDEHADRKAIISASSALSHNPSAAHTKHFVQLDPIKLNWGCVWERTLVRMMDGTEKPICDIQIGEQVCSLGGRHTTVVNIYTGEEPELYVLRAVGGHELWATADHPVCVKTGEYKAAADITPDDQLLLEDGSLVDIEALYTVQGCFKVYSLELETEAPLICNGVQTGDFQMQGRLMCPNVCAEMPSAELLEEVKTLKRFFQ